MPRGKYTLDWPLAILAGLIVVPLYWPSLQFDLYNDDYFLLRPWPAEHLINVWSGPWFDPATSDRYRPVALHVLNAMFWTFGLNTSALHVLPLVTMTVLAWLVGRFVRQETGSLAIGAVASGLYAIHPITVTAIGPWIANQYQGLVSAMLLLSLLWWQRCRDKTWRSWLPLAIPITIGALTKETALMIPLIIIVIHLLREQLFRDVRPAGAAIVTAAVAVFAGLNLWRAAVLGSFNVPALPLESIVRNYLQAPFDALFEPRNLTHPLLKYVFALSAALVVLAAGYGLMSRSRKASAAVTLTGVVILLLASVPTSFIYSTDRLTPHEVGVVLILTGGLTVLADLLKGRWRLAGAVVAAVAVVASFAISRDALSRFEPCAAVWVGDSSGLLEEAHQPPPEMLEWLSGLPKPCETARHVPFFRAVPRITWGVTEIESEPGLVVHTWIRPEVVALLDERGTSVDVALRHVSVAPGRPVTVSVSVDGGSSRPIVLSTNAWTTERFPLTPGFHTWLRQMHRVDLRVPPRDVAGLEMRPLSVSSRR